MQLQKSRSSDGGGGVDGDEDTSIRSSDTPASAHAYSDDDLLENGRMSPFLLET